MAHAGSVRTCALVQQTINACHLCVSMRLGEVAQGRGRLRSSACQWSRLPACAMARTLTSLLPSTLTGAHAIVQSKQRPADSPINHKLTGRRYTAQRVGVNKFLVWFLSTVSLKPCAVFKGMHSRLVTLRHCVRMTMLMMHACTAVATSALCVLVLHRVWYSRPRLLCGASRHDAANSFVVATRQSHGNHNIRNDLQSVQATRAESCSPVDARRSEWLAPLSGFSAETGAKRCLHTLAIAPH